MNINDIIITSRKNEKIGFARSLSERKTRDDCGLFLLEGTKLVSEALSRGVKIRQMFIRQDSYQCLPDFIREKINDADTPGEVFIVSESCYDRISTERAPQGIAAVAEKMTRHKSFYGEYTESFDKSVIILCSVRDPGNLGTIIRSAAAFGVEHVLISSDCADIYNPKTIRAAMGSIFEMYIDVADNREAAVRSLRLSGRRVFAAELRDGAVPIQEIDLNCRDCVIIGNEGHGIPEALSLLCDASIYLPVTDKVESLNAAIAASVIMWEQFKSRS